MGANAGGSDIRIALGTDGDKLVANAVHNHFVGGDVAQDDTALALVAFAGAAGHNLAQYRHILQQHVAQADTACQIQVAGDDGVAQRDARGRNGHIAIYAAQLMFAGLADGGSHGLHQHFGHLAPRHMVLRPERAVRVTAHDAGVCGGLHHCAAPFAEIAAIGKTQSLAGRGLEHHIAPQQQHGLFPSQVIVWGSGGSGSALEITHIVGDRNIVGIPGAVLYVGKGRASHLVIAVSPVHHGDKLRPGDISVCIKIAVNIAPHYAPFHQLIQIFLGPVVGGLGLRGHGRRHAAQHRQG